VKQMTTKDSMEHRCSLFSIIVLKIVVCLNYIHCLLFVS